MTSAERPWLIAAGTAHVLLIAALSLFWQQHQPMLAAPDDAVAVDLVTIADVPRTPEPPRPSMEAAPQEATAAPEVPAEPAPAPPEPVRADAVPPPEPAKATPARATPAPPASPARPALNTTNLANLIDRSLPNAARKPLDTSKLAQTLGNDAPRAAVVDPRAAATLAQAIRAQVAPCWNPPTGGRDVRRMTVMVTVRYGRDGRVIGLPQAGTPSGATAENADYARTFAETARRAVLRCQPLRLPAELYDLWQAVEINFDPEEMT